jgi:glycosyltransferase involved in cell wall biosynthesis
MPEVAEIAQRHNIPFAVHFHELQSQYNLISDADLEFQVKHSRFLVGCSTVVCDSIRLLGGAKVDLQFECVDLSAAIADPKETAEFRKSLNIPADHRIVVMAGQQSEIKGFDIFLQVAEQLRGEPLHFVWLGAARSSGFNLYYQKVAQKLAGHVTLLHPDPARYYSCLPAADLFFLSSRSDPFPLVMTEAAYAGKFIAALDSGGAREFIDGKAGTIIGSWNVPEIADAVKKLAAEKPASWSPEQSIERAKEFDAKLQAQHFAKLLHRNLGE